MVVLPPIESTERSTAPWFKLWQRDRIIVDALPDAAVGQALKAVMHYADTGEVVDLEPAALALFAVLRSHADDAQEEYTKAVTYGKTGSRKRWSK